jgi:integrase
MLRLRNFPALQLPQIVRSALCGGCFRKPRHVICSRRPQKSRPCRSNGRSTLIEPEIEQRLLGVAKQPLYDVLLIIQDAGMRPEEVFRMRWENILWKRT